MYPLRSRQNYILPLGNWAQNAIGKSYIRLYPTSDFHYYSQETTEGHGSIGTVQVSIPMVNEVFSNCIFTINFHNGYHLDANNREVLTHCTIINLTLLFLTKKK